MSTRPRSTVVFVSRVGHFGGSVVSLATVLRFLDRDIDRVLASPRGRPLMQAMEAEQLLSGELALPPSTSPSAVLVGMTRLLRWALRHRRDLLCFHANGLSDLVLTTPAAVVTRRPIVVWAHDATVVRKATRYARIAARLGGEVHWAAVSGTLADALETALGLDSRTVMVIPNPIDPLTVLGSNEAEEDDVVRVGFLGGDTFRKGFDLLPDVARGLDERARLLVFTRRHQDRTPEVERAWEELGALAPSRVEILGRQDDVRVAYGQCDVVVCPSRSESFARVAAEAMLNGIPVVASDIPALREVLVDGRAGLLVPAGDANAFANGVHRLIDDPTLRRSLVEVGRGRAVAFAPSLVVRALEGLYKSGRTAREATTS